MVELKRFRDHLKAPLNLQPRFFRRRPTSRRNSSSPWAGPAAAMRDAARGRRALSACWRRSANVADAETLNAIWKSRA